MKGRGPRNLTETPQPRILAEPAPECDGGSNVLPLSYY